MTEDARDQMAATRQGGRHLGLTTFYRNAYDTVFAAAFLVTRDRHTSEDVAQEVFVTIANDWDMWSVLPNGERIALARRAATCDGIDYVRRRKKLTELLRRAGEWVRSSDFTHVESDVIARSWVRVIANLPTQRQREIGALSFIADLPDDEIAQKLGISVSTVNTTKQRLRERLRTEHVKVKSNSTTEAETTAKEGGINEQA